MLPAVRSCITRFGRGKVSAGEVRRLGSSRTRLHRLQICICPPCPSRVNPQKHATTSSRNLQCTRSVHYMQTSAGMGQRELVLSDAQRRTIYALSTPPGKAGVAVVRISGPDALAAWQRIVRSPSRKGKTRASGPEPWKMERCKIVDPMSEEVLDDGLALFFRGPKSFTTEDVLELHIHSGRAIIASVLTSLSRLPFLRPAEAGEFTRRAFEGGRLDLTQVEGLKDLIDAETETQRKAALRVAGGSTRTQFEELRQEIIKCLALVEALIDFGEGEDLEEGVFEQARERAQHLRNRVQAILSDNRRGEILRSGIRLAIFGPPNAGKSSLLNFLAQREAAIVTHIPGTTRDILELSLDIEGLPVIVADTAGIRTTDDLVENIGVERAKQAVETADVTLLVLSLPDVLRYDQSGLRIVVPEHIKALLLPTTFVLLNKMDLCPSVSLEQVEGLLADLPSPAGWLVSLTSDAGTAQFVSGFAKALQERDDVPLITHSRHRTHLESVLRFLDAFLDTTSDDVVLGAEELRYAAQAVGKISGLIDVEDVLDVIFRDFCIGK
ncbi:tRNA modification GTPase TrmE [Artomyces pyxidatus]|uniref:tRNA modification GTPase TrmE n=1 Tax=Artomyces pyxidatus TaxID=48021 RepID=A0ACB8TKY3_9AGAM|nr:tRNA modification GTPase TrmE [Artomyces pyxidatus]